MERENNRSLFNSEWRVKRNFGLVRLMIIPIAKLLVTPNKVSFYEKFQKTYFEGNYDLINTPFNTNFVYSDLENIFLGKPFLNPDQGRWKQISNPQYYILIHKVKDRELNLHSFLIQ